MAMVIADGDHHWLQMAPLIGETESDIAIGNRQPSIGCSNGAIGVGVIVNNGDPFVAPIVDPLADKS